MRIEQTWRDQPRYCKHVWAFIYFCRRQGDTVTTRFKGDRMDVVVRREAGGEEGDDE